MAIRATRYGGNDHGETKLWNAAMNGAVDEARVLLNAGVDVDFRNERGETPLWICGQNGHVDVAALLLSRGAQVNTRRSSGESVLWIAACNDHFELVSLLLLHGADPKLLNNVEISPMWIAACNDHLEILNLLLSTGECDIDGRRHGGATALWVASQNNCPRVVSRLLRAGAQVDTVNVEGKSPLWMACQYGHSDVVFELLSECADANQACEDTCETPLWIAAHNGYPETVQMLLSAGVNLEAGDKHLGTTPAWNAAYNGHSEVLRLLAAAGATLPSDEGAADKQDTYQILLCELSDKDFSCLLSDKMYNAGFTSGRANSQTALAECLEAISRRYLQLSYLHIVGSFSEGWGNSLTRLNGTISSDSDIDVTYLTARQYHMAGVCQCVLAEGQHLSCLSRGHVDTQHSESHPATAEKGTQVRPAMDIAFAYPCCSYPPPPFISQPGHLPERLVESVSTELKRPWSCHLIRATCPGRETEQLRVSTTFLEKAAMKCLTTLQGQLFILIKYIIKRVLGRRLRSLKSYHAKTLLFNSLYTVPQDGWQKQNLEQLVRDSLHHLLEALSSREGLLRHFFVPDALVYLRSGATSADTAMEVQDVIQNLRGHLIEFQTTLATIGANAPFNFQPFFLIPLYFLETPELPEQLEYQHIYLVVRWALLSLSRDDEVPQSVYHQIEKLPQTAAYTAKEALNVLCAFKAGRTEDAKEILRCRFYHLQGARRPHVRAIPYHEAATTNLVGSFLASNDVAWQFCLRLEKPVRFDWLPSQLLRDQFPAKMAFYDKRFFVNFVLLINSLIVELLLHDNKAERDRFLAAWFTDFSQSGGADFEELYTFALYTSDVTQLRYVRERLLELSYQTSDKLKTVTRKLLSLSPSLIGRSKS